MEQQRAQTGVNKNTPDAFSETSIKAVAHIASVYADALNQYIGVFQRYPSEVDFADLIDLKDRAASYIQQVIDVYGTLRGNLPVEILQFKDSINFNDITVTSILELMGSLNKTRQYLNGLLPPQAEEEKPGNIISLSAERAKRRTNIYTAMSAEPANNMDWHMNPDPAFGIDTGPQKKLNPDGPATKKTEKLN